MQTCREHQHAAALNSASVDSTVADPASPSLAAFPRGEVVAVHHVGNAAQAVQLYEQVQQMLGESSLVHDAAVSSAPEFLVSALPPVAVGSFGAGCCGAGRLLGLCTSRLPGVHKVCTVLCVRGCAYAVFLRGVPVRCAAGDTKHDTKTVCREHI